jgi:selenocysteine lyase/cysteine desulfurase
VPLVVDASQSAGVLPIDFAGWGAEFVAMPGHKGLYGPQGTGLLLCRGPGEPLLRGGTGSQSRLAEMPDFLPDRLEPGTHNMPGVAGLQGGLSFLRRRGTESLLRYERDLCQMAADGLERMAGLQLFRSPDPENQAGVLSFRLAGRDGGEIADALAERGFALRSGLHCAPLAHRTGGTQETGTVRLSFSTFNTREEVAAFLDAIRKIAS